MLGAVQHLSLDPRIVGRSLAGPPHLVTAEAIIAFALATNDSNFQHLSGELGPPAYSINPILRTMVAAKELVTASFGFHGEHDIWFHEPIRPGMTLYPNASVFGVHERSTGVAITIRIETVDERRRLVNEQYFVSFIPKATINHDVGEGAPDHSLPPNIGEWEPLACVEYAVDADQTRRFAEASHDYDAYTLDEDAARAMGFPTTLLHGTCILAFASRAVVEHACAGEPLRLRRFAARLTNPVYMNSGQAMVTRIWPGQHAERQQVHFKSADVNGTVVITNGNAEIA